MIDISTAMQNSLNLRFIKEDSLLTYLFMMNIIHTNEANQSKMKRRKLDCISFSRNTLGVYKEPDVYPALSF